MRKIGRVLTGKQTSFVTAYLANGRNARAAYQEAYDTKAAPQRVRDQAHYLLHHPTVAAAIEAADAEDAARLSASARRFAVTWERISDELASIAFDTEVPAPTRTRALAHLASLHGFVVSKHEVRSITKIGDLTERTRRARVRRSPPSKAAR